MDDLRPARSLKPKISRVELDEGDTGGLTTATSAFAMVQIRKRKAYTISHLGSQARNPKLTRTNVKLKFEFLRFVVRS